MKYNLLGNSGLQVSEISFGCMSLGEDHVENARILHQALDEGINLFDTADLYGQGLNEISVGRAFQGKRDKVILATKVGNQWRKDGSGWDWNPTKAYILEAVEQSLQRLQTDYIDLYQLHGGTLDDPIDETIEAFELLKQQGKIRYYGISSIRPNVIREYVRRSGIVSVMMQYSLLDRRPEETCLGLLEQHKIGVLARGSLAKGMLVNKPAQPFLGYSAEEVKQAAAAIQLVSNPQRSKAETAVQYVLHHPAVTTAVVGIRTLTHLQEITGIQQAPLLSEEEIQQLQKSIKANSYSEHQ
ncbi:aldo/keto reductase [Rhodocytophaga aerolata]|uniref:Aldo/keto reductase n=1 Tax=Rhodocytophaga aerolata TaxID=455078 RepID=A0ABT8R355_9BACT|nr:aldo/keto reductase [Rhodocytophaga aerolata]MDO1445197.1 aldo/keto reductase [Rhodocytophaga aerolata]